MNLNAPPCPLCGAAALRVERREPGEFRVLHACLCVSNPETWWQYESAMDRLRQIERFEAKYLETLPRTLQRDLDLDYSYDLQMDEDNKTAIEQLDEGVAPGSFVFIHGPRGLGKTTLLARCTRNSIRQHGLSGEYAGEEELIERLRRAQDFKSGAERPDLFSSHYYHLSDLGKDGSKTEFYIRSLYSLAERRLSTGLSLLVDSNYSPLELSGRLGGGPNVEALLSRLMSGTVLAMSGPDRRTQEEF